MKNNKIAAVSYINTLPFVYGIEKSGILTNYELILDVPSACAKLMIDKKVDIALVPVAAIPQIPDCKIVTNYCIGANEGVSTVLLLSNVPINQINSIALDSDSLTSVNLIKLLCKKHWLINPDWIELKAQANYNHHESIVIIGDKSIEAAKHYKYIYDLSTEWNLYSGLPFVFACWVAKTSIDTQFLNQFEKALTFGLNQKSQAFKFYKNNINKELYWIDYLENKIDYILDEKKFKAIEIFHNFINLEL